MPVAPCFLLQATSRPRWRRKTKRSPRTPGIRSRRYSRPSKTFDHLERAARRRRAPQTACRSRAPAQPPPRFPKRQRRRPIPRAGGNQPWQKSPRSPPTPCRLQISPITCGKKNRPLMIRRMFSPLVRSKFLAGIRKSSFVGHISHIVRRTRGFVFKADGKLIGEQLERPHITKNPTRPSARRINSIDGLASARRHSRRAVTPPSVPCCASSAGRTAPGWRRRRPLRAGTVLRSGTPVPGVRRSESVRDRR
jgi:hypothetical protein